MNQSPFLTLLVLAMLTVVALPARANDAAPEDALGDIVYVGCHGFCETDGEIFIVNASGANRRRLTNNKLSESAPSWSPDGLTIAYACGGAKASVAADICSMDSAGNEHQQLTTHPADEVDPVWSPDGTRIAFLRRMKCHGGCPGPGYELFVMSAAGGTARRLTRSDWSEDSPSWSQDGRGIVFSRVKGDPTRPSSLQYDLFAVDVATRRLTNLTRSADLHERDPDVAPVDGTLVLTVQDGTTSYLATMAPGGDDTPQPLGKNESGSLPAWSPSASSVVFVDDSAEGAGLYVIDRDGGLRRQIPVGEWTPVSPDWRPSGCLVGGC